jgi:hypothetical protein
MRIRMPDDCHKNPRKEKTPVPLMRPEAVPPPDHRNAGVPFFNT